METFPIYDPICTLLEKHFNSWCDKDIIDFLSNERPMPNLEINKLCKWKDKSCLRKFSSSWYSQYNWLCGSYYLHKLFCLPCVLMKTKIGVWNTGGFSDITNAGRSLLKHDVSAEHLRCALDLKRLRLKKCNIQDSPIKNSKLHIQKFNEKVLLNRRLMQLPIKAILYLGKQGLPFTTENFNELLETLVSTSTIDIREHYKTIRHLFISETCLQMELIDCLCKYLQEDTEKELNNSNFFSIQVDDVSKNKQSQCSIIVRYVLPDDGLVKERFFGFYKTASDKNPDDFSETIINSFQSYIFPSRLIAQSYDGSCIKTEHLKFVEETIKSKSDASFVHCSAHNLNSLLEQSCNSNLQFSAFFANVSSLLSFFHECVKYSYIADTAVGKQMAELRSTLDVLTLVNNCWDCLKDIFTGIITRNDSDPFLIKESRYFLEIFTEEFEFALLAGIFGDIFDLTKSFCHELQMESNVNIDNCITEFNNVKKLLMDKRNKCAFEELYFPILIRTAPLHPESEDVYKNLYYEILDTILVQLNARFENIHAMEMLTLLHISKLGKLPHDALCRVKETYPKIFTDTKIQRLKTELQLIYADEKYQVPDPRQLLTILNQDSDVLKESYKLFSLLLALPFTRLGSISCLDRVNDYLGKSSTDERYPSMAIISIEKELVNELMDTQPFYEDVIDRFGERLSTIDLILKK